MDLLNLIPTYLIALASFLIIFELERLRREIRKVKSLALE